MGKGRMVRMLKLNPTLWRTCKMLAGKTRIRLLRQLHGHPGEGVTALGRRAGLKEAAASQELRRIQARGLLQAERRGLRLIYRMAADPQVVSATPLLKAIQTALSDLPPERDEEMAVIAAGLAHGRRIRIVRALLAGPVSAAELPFAVRIPAHPFQVHLETLLASGFAIRTPVGLQFTVPDHPLAKALAKLIRQGAAR